MQVSWFESSGSSSVGIVVGEAIGETGIVGTIRTSGRGRRETRGGERLNRMIASHRTPVYGCESLWSWLVFS